MNNSMINRWVFALIGGTAGYLLWLLADGMRAPVLGERAAFFAIALTVVFTGGLFAMSGRMRLGAAALRALVLAVLVAGLLLLVSLRWSDADDIFEGPTHFLAIVAVSLLPLPFLMAFGQQSASEGSGIQNMGSTAPSAGRARYKDLFDISWEMISRGAIAFCFTGMVWLVIWLSGMLLEMVGITLVEDLLMRASVAMVISGAGFGLAVAVANEVSALVSPRLIHWLLRLLLPIVTLVSAVFVVAVILRGYGGGLRGMSPSLVLLGMAAAGISLITVTLDADDDSASKSPVILWSARGMAVLLPVLAGLSLRAIGIRIGEQGLTPNRLFVLVLGLIALVYGLAYLAALLRGIRRGKGGGFAAGVRAQNPWLALGVILCAALWLTPLFNAEAISARDQVSRVMDGRKPAAAISWSDFVDLGLAGDAARARLIAHAEANGDSALAARLEPGRARPGDLPEPDRSPELRAALEALMPVMPASSGGTKTMMLLGLNERELENMLSACQSPTGESGHPGCLMVVADLLPAEPGEEAVVLLVHSTDWVEGRGIWIDRSGVVRMRDLQPAGGGYLSQPALRALFDQWREAPPPVAPAQLNQLGTGDEGVLFGP